MTKTIMKMNNKNKHIIIFLQIILVVFCITKTTIIVESQERLDYVGSRCFQFEDIASNNSNYYNNIQKLLSNLQSFSSLNKFSNSSEGVGLNAVHGSYLCRPDIPLSNCQVCVNATISKIQANCFDKKEALVWYEQCMISYTNKSVSASNGTDPWTYNYVSGLNVTQPREFPQLLNETIQSLISEAITSNNEAEYTYFAHREAKFTALEGLYGMVLCRPDITPEKCEQCLTTASGRIRTCCGGLSVMTYIFQPHCQVWYDTAPFIISSQRPPSTVSLTPAPAPAPAPALAPALF